MESQFLIEKITVTPFLRRQFVDRSDLAIVVNCDEVSDVLPHFYEEIFDTLAESTTQSQIGILCEFIRNISPLASIRALRASLQALSATDKYDRFLNRIGMCMSYWTPGTFVQYGTLKNRADSGSSFNWREQPFGDSMFSGLSILNEFQALSILLANVLMGARTWTDVYKVALRCLRDTDRVALRPIIRSRFQPCGVSHLITDTAGDLPAELSASVQYRAFIISRLGGGVSEPVPVASSSDVLAIHAPPVWSEIVPIPPTLPEVEPFVFTTRRRAIIVADRVVVINASINGMDIDDETQLPRVDVLSPVEAVEPTYAAKLNDPDFGISDEEMSNIRTLLHRYLGIQFRFEART